MEMNGDQWTINGNPVKSMDIIGNPRRRTNKNKSISFFDRGKKNEGTFIGLNDEGFAKIDINGKIETFNSINIT